LFGSGGFSLARAMLYKSNKNAGGRRSFNKTVYVAERGFAMFGKSFSRFVNIPLIQL